MTLKELILDMQVDINELQMMESDNGLSFQENSKLYLLLEIIDKLRGCSALQTTETLKNARKQNEYLLEIIKLERQLNGS